MDVVPARVFNALYIYLDIAWLVIFTAILVWRRRYAALLAGVAGCVIYFIADYGIFYLALGTRSVTGASPVWLLLWLSISYGLTNFAWIWLLLDRDGHAVEWSLLPLVGSLAVATLGQGFGADWPVISIYRGTASYHGVMALIMAAGYTFLVIRNLRAAPGDRANLLRLLAIGIGIQFSWEAILLINGIRPAGILPLIVDSLVETNMGMPYLYLIHRAISRRFNEDLSRLPR